MDYMSRECPYSGKPLMYPDIKGHDTKAPKITEMKLSLNKEITLKYLTSKSKVFEPYCSYGQTSLIWNLKTENLYCIDFDTNFMKCFLHNDVKCKMLRYGDNLTQLDYYPIEEMDLIDLDPFGNPWPIFNKIKDRISDKAILCITTGEGFGYKANKAKQDYHKKKLAQYGKHFEEYDKTCRDHRYFGSKVVNPYILEQLPNFKLVVSVDSSLINRSVFVHKDREFELEQRPECV